MIKKVFDVLDSRPFQIFFALWTGLYLVQVIRRTAGAPKVDELSWIGIGFVAALFLI